jgi:hypothetical protein
MHITSSIVVILLPVFFGGFFSEAMNELIGLLTLPDTNYGNSLLLFLLPRVDFYFLLLTGNLFRLPACPVIGALPVVRHRPN